LRDSRWFGTLLDALAVPPYTNSTLRTTEHRGIQPIFERLSHHRPFWFPMYFLTVDSET
jgi:hypothetical protein